jgi:hypothetical protein
MPSRPLILLNQTHVFLASVRSQELKAGERINADLRRQLAAAQEAQERLARREEELRGAQNELSVKERQYKVRGSYCSLSRDGLWTGKMHGDLEKGTK